MRQSDIRFAECGQLADAEHAVIEEKQRIDDAAVIVDMLVERIAELIDQADSAQTGVGRRIGAAIELRALVLTRDPTPRGDSKRNRGVRDCRTTISCRGCEF